MARNITVTFDDGTTHVYQNAPDDVTPDAVQARAEKDFGKSVTHLDGGKAAPSPAAAAPGEGMPTGPRNAGGFERLTPATPRPTAADIMRARQEEEVGAPGISPGVDPRAVAYPMMEMGGMALGSGLTGGLGTIPAVLGAGAGYAAVKAGERPLAQQSLAQTAEDIGTGALYDVGGRLITTAAAPVIGGVIKLGKKALGKAPPAAPTVEELKAQSNALRTQMYETGQQFDPNVLKTSVEEGIGSVSPQYPVGKLAKEVSPKTQAALDAIDDLIAKHSEGGAIPVDQLEHVNTLLNDAVRAGGRDARYAMAAKTKLNEFAEATGGETAQLWRQAKDLEARQFRVEELQNIADSANSKVMRKKFEEILNSNAIRSYTPEQQIAIQQLAKGTATQKTLELISSLAPQNMNWRNIAGMLGLGTITHAGGPLAGVAAYGAGATSRAAANALTRGDINALSEMVRGGQLAPPVDLSFLRPAAGSALLNYTQPSQNALAQ